MSPLSEHEQKVLLDLELSLLSDSRKGDSDVLTGASVYVKARRGVIVSAVAFIAGSVLLIMTLTSSMVMAAIGLGVMVAAAVTFAHRIEPMIHARRMLRPKHR